MQGQGRDEQGQGRDKQEHKRTSRASPCLSVFVPACPCLSLSVPVCPFLSLYVPVCLYLSLSFPCLSLSSHVCPCQSLSVPVCPRDGKTYKRASNACVNFFLAWVKSLPNLTLFCCKSYLCRNITLLGVKLMAFNLVNF